MKSSTSSRFSLRDLLEEQSRDHYDAQSAFLGFAGEMDRGIENSELHSLIGEISLATRRNIADLESVCSQLGAPPEGVKCEAMAGLLREAKGTNQEYDSGAVKDAAIIANAQRIAHYEIAGFGTARAFADQLKLGQVAELFDEMLERSEANDRELTKIARGSWLSGGINNQAANEK